MKLTKSTLFAAILSTALVPATQAAVLDVNCAGGTFLDVQSAVNAAAPGDVIVVQACTYPNGFAILGKSDLQIVAADAPAGSFGAFPVGRSINPPSSSMQMYDTTTTCVTIDSSQNISIVGLLLEACRGFGIEINGSDNIEIHGNALYYADRDGVSIAGSRHVTVSGNFLFGAVQPGQSGVSVDSGSALVRIHNNRIMKNAQGISMKGQYIDVINNEVAGNVGLGIYVASDSSTVARNHVQGNGSGLTPQIDFTALPLNTCVVGNDTNVGILPWAVGCQSDNN
jgi:hypothetical protein